MKMLMVSRTRSAAAYALLLLLLSLLLVVRVSLYFYFYFYFSPGFPFFTVEQQHYRSKTYNRIKDTQRKEKRDGGIKTLLDMPSLNTD